MATTFNFTEYTNITMICFDQNMNKHRAFQFTVVSVYPQIPCPFQLFADDIRWFEHCLINESWQYILNPITRLHMSVAFLNGHQQMHMIQVYI